VNNGAVDGCVCRAVDKTVDERRVWILKDLLDWATELIRGLSPIVIFHRDYKNSLDLLRVGVGAAEAR
jgi:hypothetical protein